MAQFNADILFNADVRQALRGVDKLEGGVRSLVKEIDKFEDTFKSIAAGPSNKIALERQRRLAGAINQQNRLLAQQVTIASQLAERYDSAAVSAAAFTRSVEQAARASQKLLPGTGPGQRALPAAGGSSQKLLPAAGGTGAGARGFERAAARAAEIDAESKRLADATREAALAAERGAQARQEAARRAEVVAAESARLAQAVQRRLPPADQKLLPAATQASRSGPAGAPPLTATSRYQQKLQAEVDRQIRLTGKLNEETAERVAQYNKAQQFEDKLIKSTGRLSTARTKAAKQTGGGGSKRNKLGSALVGGAFPALFGGGPGAIIGGFVGELFGQLGGVVGSAIGSQFDKIGASAIALGQALGGLNPDIDRLIDGLGLAGTKTGALVKSIEKAEGAQVAQALAAEQMAVLVGTDGVQALKDAGEAATELGQEASKAFTALAVALAPALEAVSDFLAKEITEQRQLSRVDPGIFGIGAGDLAERDSVKQVKKDFASREIDETEARARLLEIVRQIEAVEQQIFDTRLQSKRTLKESYDQVEAQYELSRAALEVARLGGDLKNDAVYAAEQNNIKLRFAVQYQELLNEAVVTEADRRIVNLKLLALENKELAALANLENRRNKAFTSRGRSAPKSKSLQLQQQLIKEELKRTDIGIKALQIIQGEEAALKVKQSLLVDRLAKETDVLELQRKQALENNKVAGDVALINQLYDSRINTLTQQLQLLYGQNAERLRALALERELQQLQADQAFATESTGLNRELEDIQARMTNPLGGFQAEQLELATEQARRYEDVMRDITNQEELLQKQRTDANASTVDPQLKQLERKRQLYEEMLPAIAAAEQAELKMAQILQTIQPVTDAIAAGISNMFIALVDGSKSAEEAISDMLGNIGQMLIQTATQALMNKAVQMLLSALSPASATPLTFFEPRTPGLASGGSAMADRPYLVGENGPELFVPQTSGRVVNNTDSQMALERYTYQDNSPAKPPQPINVQYNVTDINGMRFVTEDQLQRASAAAAQQGAKSGETRVMSSLRNSRSRRKSLGL